MANKVIYAYVDEEVKQKFLVKLALNGKKQSEVINKFVLEYTFGKKVPKKYRIRPVITKRMKGVKVTRAF